PDDPNFALAELRVLFLHDDVARKRIAVLQLCALVVARILERIDQLMHANDSQRRDLREMRIVDPAGNVAVSVCLRRRRDTVEGPETARGNRLDDWSQHVRLLIET